MNKNSWSDDDRAEYELLVATALSEPAVPRRRDAFLDGLDGALQAHRYWARDVLRDIRDAGADRILKREHELRHRSLIVSHEGKVLGRVRRTLGVRRHDTSGGVENHRALFDYASWDELRAKLPYYVQQIDAFQRDAHAVIKLLTLESLVPDAANPAEACTQLGTTVDDFLAESQAS